MILPVRGAGFITPAHSCRREIAHHRPKAGCALLPGSGVCALRQVPIRPHFFFHGLRFFNRVRRAGDKLRYDG